MKQLTITYRELFTLIILLIISTAMVVYFGTNKISNSEAHSILAQTGSIQISYDIVSYSYNNPITEIELEALARLSKLYETIELNPTSIYE